LIRHLDQPNVLPRVATPVMHSEHRTSAGLFAADHPAELGRGGHRLAEYAKLGQASCALKRNSSCAASNSPRIVSTSRASRPRCSAPRPRAVHPSTTCVCHVVMHVQRAAAVCSHSRDAQLWLAFG